MKRIARSTLIRLTEETIERNQSLSRTQRVALKQVAKTAKAIAVDYWWNPDTECGCLVGNVLHTTPGQSDLPEGESSRYYRVGMTFCDLLTQHIGTRNKGVSTLKVTG